MTTSPIIERLEFPSLAPELPAESLAPSFVATSSRLPSVERVVLPERSAGTFGEAEWEKIAAGVLAGFGSGIVAAFMLATLAF